MEDWIGDQVFNRMLTWLDKAIIGALDALWGLLSTTAFVSPDVTKLPQVAAFAGTSLTIVNTCYVLAFLWAALLVMGRGTIQSDLGPGELIPRLVIGLIGANAAVPLCSAVIKGANALTAALTGQDITGPNAMQHLHDTTMGLLAGGTNGQAIGFLILLIGLLIAILTATLIVQWIIRLGVLVIAVGVAPIALALHGTPQTDGIARTWWRIMTGALGTVILQAVALHTTLTIFLNPDANLHLLGLPVINGEPAAVLNLLIIVCLLWSVIKIPGLLRRFTASRPSAVGTVLRVVAVQQVTSRLSRAVHTVRGGATTGARRGSAARLTSASASGGTGRGTRGGGSRPPRASGAASRPASPGPGRPAARAAGPSRPTSRTAGPARPATHTPRRPAPPPYTREELAGGVDLYTQALQRRKAASPVPRPHPYTDEELRNGVETYMRAVRRRRPPVRVLRPPPYTREELAGGVDLYTQALRRRAARESDQGA